jgi:glutathione S-transferase
MENLEDKSEAFKAEFARAAVDAKGNPSVPILTHRGATMVESALVLRYIAETFETSAKSLLPKDTVKGYYGQLFADTFQTCVPLYFKILRATSQDELDVATKDFIGGLQKANRCLELGAKARAGGPYACGEQFTIWDIMPMTFVPRFEIVLAHYRGFNLRVALKENGCDALEAWIAAVGARPSLVSTLKQIEEIRGITVQQAFIDHFAKFVSWRA